MGQGEDDGYDTKHLVYGSSDIVKTLRGVLERVSAQNQHHSESGKGECSPGRQRPQCQRSPGGTSRLLLRDHDRSLALPRYAAVVADTAAIADALTKCVLLCPVPSQNASSRSWERPPLHPLAKSANGIKITDRLQSGMSP